MRKLIITLFFLNSFVAFSQKNFVALDTVLSPLFNTELINEYKLKYESLNKKMDQLNLNQKKIIKEIYLENQKNFLEKLNENNFLSDKNINFYLQGLLNEILSKNKIDVKEYRILLSKDSEKNAYNTGDGTIVVNYGLFLILENEDELVFVISHEVGHQYLNHVKKEIETFAKSSTSQEIISRTNEIKKQKYKRASLANDLLKTIRYKDYSSRRKKEIEADSLGYYLYKKTSRDTKNTISLLSKLDKSEMEKDSLTIQDYRLIFENDGFKLKAKYFESEASLFQKYDSQSRFSVDSLKTHPDCASRIQLLKKLQDNSENKSLHSAAFSEIKSNCIFQNLINLYSEKEYGICLYETLKLYKSDKENTDLKKLIFLSLNGIYKSKANYTISKYIPIIDNRRNSASLNTFINFINNIKLSDLEILINQFKQ